MDNGAQPRSALGSLRTSLPCFGGGSGMVLELREIPHGHIMELARPRPGAALDAVLAAFRTDRLPRTGESRSVDSSSLLGIGPDRLLLITAEDVLAGSPDGLVSLAEAFGIAVETGDAWTQFAISGSAGLDLLAKGCVLDLHPRSFPEGACAATRFAQLRCVLHRVAGSYRLLVGRSYARSLAEWLIEAAAEFGLGLGDKAPSESPSSDMRPYNRPT